MAITGNPGQVNLKDIYDTVNYYFLDIMSYHFHMKPPEGLVRDDLAIEKDLDDQLQKMIKDQVDHGKGRPDDETINKTKKWLLGYWLMLRTSYNDMQAEGYMDQWSWQHPRG